MPDRDTPSLPVGKLPPHLLARLLDAAPLDDPRVLQRTRSGWEPCPLPERDGLARVFESEPDARG